MDLWPIPRTRDFVRAVSIASGREALSDPDLISIFNELMNSRAITPRVEGNDSTAADYTLDLALELF
jgi:hypothetical protein